MSKRIDAIVNLIDECDVLADIGCDHGFVGIFALEQNKAQKVLFSDISEPSLDKARKQCFKKNLANAEFFVQDGIPNTNADTVVIAGMGGLETIKILKEAQYKPHKLVLQPMKDIIKLRQYLAQSYMFVKDEIIFDKKYYNMLSLTSASCPTVLTEAELFLGKTNLAEKSQDFLDYVKKETNKCIKILANQPNEKISHYLSVLASI